MSFDSRCTSMILVVSLMPGYSNSLLGGKSFIIHIFYHLFQYNISMTRTWFCYASLVHHFPYWSWPSFLGFCTAFLGLLIYHTEKFLSLFGVYMLQIFIGLLLWLQHLLPSNTGSMTSWSFLHMSNLQVPSARCMPPLWTSFTLSTSCW